MDPAIIGPAPRDPTLKQAISLEGGDFFNTLRLSSDGVSETFPAFVRRLGSDSKRGFRVALVPVGFSMSFRAGEAYADAASRLAGVQVTETKLRCFEGSAGRMFTKPTREGCV